MAHASRFRTLNSLLSTTPPMAVRLNLHSDVLEESALRSTTDGTLSSRPPAAAAPPAAAPPTAAKALAAFAALI